MIETGLCQCGCGTPTPLAKWTDRRHGLIRGVPTRYINGHHGWSPKPPYVIEERGFSTPCWIWQRARNSDGYGNLRIRGTSYQAHVVYFERLHGAVPKGMELDHLCRQRCCVNPDHLEVVTPTVNSQRGLSAKLTPGAVVFIRTSGASASALAARFGVHPMTIRSVLKGKSWRNITIPDGGHALKVLQAAPA